MTILNVTQTSGLRPFGLTLNVKNSVVFQYPIQLVVAVVKHASNTFNNFILLFLNTNERCQRTISFPIFLPSSQPPREPTTPLSKSQIPRSTLSKAENLSAPPPPCRPAQFHGRLVFGHSQALSRSEAPSPPVET